MLSSSWGAVRDENVQARITDGPAVFWTVLNVELVVCSWTLVAVYRGTCTWTYTSDLRDGMEALEAKHLDF